MLPQWLLSYLTHLSSVELHNCQILSKTGGEHEERWKPWTPRCCLAGIILCSIIIVSCVWAVLFAIWLIDCLWE